MLDRKHWPALLERVANRIAEAERELGTERMRVEVYDESYDLVIRVPRVLVNGSKAKLGDC
ncbi:hypothetical protein LZC95_49955 [Pendulispora brunnea]|uniref:Uncharacterized protein n=1 Tax=Pendulispora brunnea TaxID=2905690 RepID=A0ABZ2K766_9BACT